MGKLYIGDFGKLGEYFAPTTNFQDQQCTVNFDGSRFKLTDDALYIGLHVVSIDGLSEKSTCKFPCNVLFKLSTKPYEYESFSGGAKKKEMVEPSNREKLLYHYLTGEDPELNYEKCQGKGGMLMLGEYSNDAAILAGDGNAKKHSRFVVEFDDDIKPFDMSGDSFSLDNIASGTAKSGKGYSGRPAETEQQKIDARVKTIETLVKTYLDAPSDISDQVLNKAVNSAMCDTRFLTLVSLALGLPIPSNFKHYDD